MAVQEELDPPLPALGEARAAHGRGQDAELAADPEARQLGVTWIVLEDEQPAGTPVTKPTADPEAPGPGLPRTTAVFVWVWKVERMLWGRAALRLARSRRAEGGGPAPLGGQAFQFRK